MTIKTKLIILGGEYRTLDTIIYTEHKDGIDNDYLVIDKYGYFMDEDNELNEDMFPDRPYAGWCYYTHFECEDSEGDNEDGGDAYHTTIISPFQFR